MTTQNLIYLQQMFANFFHHAWLKVASALVMGALTYTIGIEKFQLAGALLFLICTDFVMAWLKAFYTGEPIQSAKALRTGIKIAVYFLLVASAHVAEPASGLPFLDETMIGFLTVTEMISILEHASALGFKTPKLLLNQLKGARE